MDQTSRPTGGADPGAGAETTWPGTTLLDMYRGSVVADGMGGAAPPEAALDDGGPRRLRRLVPLDHGLSVVITRRADLTPHTSRERRVVRHPSTGLESVAFVSARGTHKLINLRMDPTVAVVIRAGWHGRPWRVAPRWWDLTTPNPGSTTSGCACCCERSSVQQEGARQLGGVRPDHGTRGTYCGVRGSAAGGSQMG